MNQRIAFAIILLAALFTGLLSSRAVAQQNTMLSGTVTGADGKALEGVLVFVYAGPDVHRSADFTSPPTDRDGRYRMTVPPGRYWAVARLKKIEGFGPLMPGDRHSGEPREVEIGPGQDVEMDLVVADLKEAMRAKRKDREGPVRISGRILDDNGGPVRGAYAVANRTAKIVGMPDYLSAWTDEQGRYTLVVPRGLYSVGSATTFPPGDDLVIFETVTADADRAGLDIIRRSVGQDKSP